MTIRELYGWAKEQEALDSNIMVRDTEGKLCYDLEPVIIIHNTFYNYICEDTDIESYKEVEFR